MCVCVVACVCVCVYVCFYRTVLTYSWLDAVSDAALLRQERRAFDCSTCNRLGVTSKAVAGIMDLANAIIAVLLLGTIGSPRAEGCNH